MTALAAQEAPARAEPRPAQSRALKPQATIRRALSDPKLLGKALPGPSWELWRIMLIAIMGEPLTPIELEQFQRFTGRRAAPTRPVRECWAIIGRRGGKSKAMSVLAAYLATLCETKLSPGEWGTVTCLAQNQRSAAIVLSYIEAALSESVILKKLIRRRTGDMIELTNRIRIEVRAASFRGLRGSTYVAAIADEISFWPQDESSNPDVEILAAVRPGLLTTRGPLIAISTPYSRRGALWEAFRRNYGNDGDPDVLVLRGASRDFHPDLSQEDIDRELAADPERNAAEYLAEFRIDVEGFLNVEMMQACVDRDVKERPFERKHRYFAFTDPSGGSADSFTLAVAHLEGKTAVLDLVRETKPPFSPEATVEHYAGILKGYQVTMVYGDRYAGEWPREQFRKHGINYEPSERDKSAIYTNALPLFTSRTAGLLDNQVLIRQLVALERHTGRSGKDSVTHPPGGRDDVANAACGVLLLANEKGGGDPNFDRDIVYPNLGIY